MIRALETLSFGLCLLGWLLLGVFGTWQEPAPFWLGAPLLWITALTGLFTIRRGVRGSLSRGALISVLVFTAFVLWRAGTSDVAYLARQDAVFAATALIGWSLTALRFESSRHRFALIAVWSLLIVANLGMGLWQQSGHPQANALSFMGFGRNTVDSVFAGFFPNSNHLCAFLELTSFMVLGIAVYGRVHSFVRVLCGLVFAAAVVTAALSTSRAGLLAMAVGGMVFFAAAMIMRLMKRNPADNRRPFTVLAFAGMVAGCLAFGVFAWGQLEAKFGEGRVLNNLNGRAEMWERAYEQWQLGPFLGTGARSFEYFERAFRNMETKWVTWSETDVDAIFAHNDWLQLLADYGLAGLVLALGVLGIHCWRGFSFVLADAGAAGRTGGGFTDHRGAMVLGALCGILAFSVHCVADFNMHIGVLAVLAATVLGMLANPGEPGLYRSREEDPPDGPSQRALRATGTVAAALPAAVMTWSFLPWAIGDYNYYKGLAIFNRGAESLEDSFTASAVMRTAVEADPRNYNSWIRLGLAYKLTAEMLGENVKTRDAFLARALDSFRTAYRLYPQNADISMYLGRTLDGMRRLEEADGWWQTALQWGDGSRLVHHYYGDHLMALGKYEEASVHYIAALHRHEGWKRELLQRKFTRAVELVRQQKQKAPPAAMPQADQPGSP